MSSLTLMPGAKPTYEAMFEGQVALDTGALTPQQINLLLTHLPVDVTLIDENDTVRYYSQGPERIFVRTESIIGRKVQNCHPPASVHVVNKLLDQLRSGPARRGRVLDSTSRANSSTSATSPCATPTVNIAAASR